MRRGRGSPGLPVDPARVAQARREAGLTLSALAGGQVSRTFIHQVEHGISRPSIDVLKLIARKTGKPMDYFLRTGRSDAITSAELVKELSTAFKLVRKITSTRAVGTSTTQSMQLLADSVRRALALARAGETTLSGPAHRSR